jgi:hypothetical protein
LFLGEDASRLRKDEDGEGASFALSFNLTLSSLWGVFRRDPTQPLRIVEVNWPEGDERGFVNQLSFGFMIGQSLRGATNSTRAEVDAVLRSPAAKLLGRRER